MSFHDNRHYARTGNLEVAGTAAVTATIEPKRPQSWSSLASQVLRELRIAVLGDTPTLGPCGHRAYEVASQ